VQKVLFVIDRNNVGDGVTFAQGALDAGTALPLSLSTNTVNRSLNLDAVVKTQIFNGINQGPLLINYLGHGSIEVWTSAALLSTSDVAALNNNTLPVWLMMTCLNGSFQDPNRTSLAEALMRRNSGGAVAVWASSGMTDALSQARLNKQFYIQLFSNGAVTLGEAAKKAKQNVTDMDVRKTWILFGDPTMKLQ
jgi:hypothetical protein